MDLGNRLGEFSFQADLKAQKELVLNALICSAQ